MSTTRESGWRQRFAARLRPVTSPKLISYTGAEIQADSVLTVAFSSLDMPELSETQPLSVYPSLTPVPLLSQPVPVDLQPLTFLFTAEEVGTINMTTLLKAPKVAGRVYSDGVDEHRPLTQVPPKQKRSVQGAIASLACRHGIPESLCAECQKERVLTGFPRTPTIDPFAELWFVLQPPILQRLEEVDVFPGGRKPYGFQVAGVKWLLDHKSALLADQMGLGKTIQAIVALRVLFRQGKARQALIVCPLSVAENWMQEFANWAPELRTIRVAGDPGQRSDRWQAPVEVKVVTYDSLRADIASSRFHNDDFDVCIIDEAQYIKNPQAARSRAVKRLSSTYKWALTGTPIESDVTDAESVFQFVLGSNFSGVFGRAPVVSAERLRALVKPYTLRRTYKDELVDLPELTSQSVWLELGGNQRQRYDAAERQGISELQRDGTTRMHVFALINKLKQICNLDPDSRQSTKLEYLRGQLDELVANDEKALVFSQYPRASLKQIAPRLSNFNPRRFDGSLNERERRDMIEDFQDGADCKVLLMGVKSGGIGVNLTRANHVFHFDLWWTPAAEDQATHRVYRIGQGRPVFVQSLHTLNTIEERIVDLLEQKRQLFDEVFDGISDDENLNKRLSDDDIFGLFDLPAPRPT